MRNVALALVALAALLSIASHLAPDARAQGVAAFASANPRSWPPRPEDMVNIAVRQPEFGTGFVGEFPVFQVPADKWLVLIEHYVGGAGPDLHMFASATAFSDEIDLTEFDIGFAPPQEPLGIACPPSSRLFVRSVTGFNEIINFHALQGYLVDAL